MKTENHQRETLDKISNSLLTKLLYIVYNNGVGDVYIALGIIYAETPLQVGSPALNRRNLKKKEPFLSSVMLPQTREHFLYREEIS